MRRRLLRCTTPTPCRRLSSLCIGASTAGAPQCQQRGAHRLRHLAVLMWQEAAAPEEQPLREMLHREWLRERPSVAIICCPLKHLLIC